MSGIGLLSENYNELGLSSEINMVSENNLGPSSRSGINVMSQNYDGPSLILEVHARSEHTLSRAKLDVGMSENYRGLRLSLRIDMLPGKDHWLSLMSEVGRMSEHDHGVIGFLELMWCLETISD